MNPMVAILAIFKATLDKKPVVLKDKEQAAKDGDYIVNFLVTMAALVDKSKATLVSPYEAILYS